MRTVHLCTRGIIHPCCYIIVRFILFFGQIEKEVESAEEDNNVEKLENELEDSLAQPKDSDLETVLEKRGFSSR